MRHIAAAHRGPLVIGKCLHARNAAGGNVNHELVCRMHGFKRGVVVAVHKMDGLGQVQLVDGRHRHLEVARNQDGVHGATGPRGHHRVLKVADPRVYVRANHEPDHAASNL